MSFGNKTDFVSAQFSKWAPSAFLILLLSACSGAQAQNALGTEHLSAAALILLQAVNLVVMLAAVLSLALVVVPGLTIIWVTTLIYGILAGFGLAGGICFALISALMIFGNTVDQVLMGARARKSGASWTGVIASMLAALIFSLLFPPFGGLIAALVVLFVIESLRLRNWRRAGESTREMAMGCASAVLARMGIGLVMIGLWALWVWLAGQWPF